MKHLPNLLNSKLFRAGLLFCSSVLGLLISTVASAQLSSPTDVAQFVYRRLPNLPIENRYVRVEGNKQAVDSTLVSRLIQYHSSIKGRSPLYRLDWKTTLADYLGVNEFLQPETYPGYAFLKSNPLEKDRSVIQKLNVSERNALVQALVDAYGGNQAAVAPTRIPAVPQEPKPTSSYRPKLNPLAVPGSADSLKTAPRRIPSSRDGEAQFLK